MWQIHHSIITIALLNEKPLLRWLTSIVILLPKDSGQPKIHRLRIINTYESEYNLILKYFWANKGMRIAEKKEWLGDNQTGGRKGMSASETAVINEIILDIHRITREPICSHQDDAIGCYDRIIRNHAMLNSRKNGIPENMCKMYCNAHYNMMYKNQIKNKNSE